MSFFNSQTIVVNFERENCSVLITLKPNQNGPYLYLEQIFELENFFNWISGHTEVRNILIQSETRDFSHGLDPELLSVLNTKQFNSQQERLKKLIFSLLHLPQTLIVDLGEGVSGAGIELALAADIRIAHRDCVWKFDFLKKGQLPSCGGMIILNELIGMGKTQDLIHNGKNLYSTQAKQWALLKDHYNGNRESLINDLFNGLNQQSQVAQIQLKRLFLNKILKNWEENQEQNAEIIRASNFSGDWKNSAVSQLNNTLPQFSRPSELKEKIQFLQHQESSLIEDLSQQS